MRAVITVVGKDMVGIVATVATECAATNANILDVTQSVFEDDIFAMVMLVDVSKLSCPLPELSDRLNPQTNFPTGSLSSERKKGLISMSCTRIFSIRCTASDREDLLPC